MSVEVIAEIAQGYQGEPALARLLVDAALASGAPAVKMQLVIADELATPGHEYYTRYRSMQMDDEVWQELADRVHANQRRMYLDVFGPQSVSKAQAWGVDGVKIHASDFHNDELVETAIRSFDRVYVSTGGLDVEEMARFVSHHEIGADSPVRMMYGFQAYPTQMADNNLRRFLAVQERFPSITWGFMDHSDGDSRAAWYVPIMAMAAGAAVLEKHLTVAHNTEMIDHWSGLTPDEMTEFVALVDFLEPALGSSSLELSAAEKTYRVQALKTVVASREIAAGVSISADDLILKRSASPGIFVRTDEVVGRTAARPITQNEPIAEEDVR